MAAITSQQARDQLALWMEADAAVAKGQAWSGFGRTLTRVNASEITEKIEYWSGKVSELEAEEAGGAGARVRYGVGAGR